MKEFAGPAAPSICNKSVKYCRTRVAEPARFRGRHRRAGQRHVSRVARAVRENTFWPGGAHGRQAAVVGRAAARSAVDEVLAEAVLRSAGGEDVLRGGLGEAPTVLGEPALPFENETRKSDCAYTNWSVDMRVIVYAPPVSLPQLFELTRAARVAGVRGLVVVQVAGVMIVFALAPASGSRSSRHVLRQPSRKSAAHGSVVARERDVKCVRGSSPPRCRRTGSSSCRRRAGRR